MTETQAVLFTVLATFSAITLFAISVALRGIVRELRRIANK